MNKSSNRYERLIELGRKTPQSDGVPYAFEQRVMANLPTIMQPASGWHAWEPALWKLAPMGALMLMLAVAGNWWIPDSSTATDEADQEITATTLALVEEW